MSRREKAKKLTAVEVLVVAFVCLFVLAIAGPASQKSRFDADRTQCMKNLSTIGKAMVIYANDYDGQFPRSGGRNSTWSTRILHWQAPNRYLAYGLAADSSGGMGSISSCFYLLVKYMDVNPKTFVCPGDAGTTTFNPADYSVGDRELIDLWDFGPEPPDHCSYSYHLPFSLYHLTTSSEPKLAVAADRNPWLGSRTGKVKDIGLSNPDGGREAVKASNSTSHDDEGQNVLFVDGHVSSEDHSFCGINDDNIYTSWDGGDIRRGALPTIVSLPADRNDSFLVNEPPTYRATTVRQPRNLNSADLKETSVVPTLDSAIPKNKNVIWCGTFQMAWDKFKNDIIGEPVQLIDAEELASRLNKGEFSPDNIEADSFYTAAGFVEDGIIEQIQNEMARRFPSEPRPTFDDRYRKLPKASVAYSFLSLDAGFKYPFYTNNQSFPFQDSKGSRTDVTSFRESSQGRDPNSENVSKQVEILHYKFGQRGGAAEFSVDLCRHTDPYQVVLARVPRGETLGETLAQVQKYIAEFKQDQYYNVLRELRPIDSLIVPDVLYKLTHHFKELEDKSLANPKRRELGYLIFEARQMVHFSLSRTGVILKSQAVMGGGGAAAPPIQIEQPRHLYFDRPFLIYVQKRGEEFSPFFVMWVDNAELMEKF
ncbi:MAG: hypothetical protein ABIF19_02905 [Planctomycetota bacterium]